MTHSAPSPVAATPAAATPESPSTACTIRVELPAHLRTLAGLHGHELQLAVEPPITQRSILDALEARYPMLEGTLRDHTTRLRRPFIRFFAGEEDLSHISPDDPLPASVANGREPFLILGAIAGGSARLQTSSIGT